MVFPVVIYRCKSWTIKKAEHQKIDSFWPHGLQNARLPCTSLSPSLLKFMSFEWVMEPSYWTTHYAGTISSFVPTFSSCHQSFPGSGSFPMSWPFPSGGQSIGASASGLVLPMNIQGWFPLGLIGLISLLSQGFSGVFFNTIVLWLKV